MNPLLRAAWVADTVRNHLWLLRRADIARGDLVLDVGSGASPFLRADILCDLLPDDASQRGGQSIKKDRPFLVGDVQHLPFKDRVFDYAVCSHVLEHVDNPADALDELQRVARRGYIETPAAEWEKIQGFTFHKWMVSVEDGTLHFVAKSSALVDPALREWFTTLQQRLRIERKVWFARRHVGIYASLFWENRINYEVHGTPQGNFPGVDANAKSAGNLVARLFDLWGKRIRRHPRTSRRSWKDG